MLNSPNKVIQKDAQIQKPFAQLSLDTDTQHGLQQIPSYFLGIPEEILTGITSHLDPPSLQNLALVNKRLYSHIKDDNTWQRAFVQQFLGIDFQSELHDSHKRLLLRREARTWREEFVARFNLCRKWAFSRNTTVRHIPVHSVISSMHLMPAHSAVLCASTAYGIVSRSFPLTGKILPGYLNPLGPRLGGGLGNPNVEFAPNVSACSLASDSGTAKVLWGIRNGEVTVTVAHRAIDSLRRGVNFQLTRCLIDDEHDGPVLDVAWDDNELAVTGAADGRMKLWDTKNMSCLWTSERQNHSLVTDPVVKVVSAVVTKDVVVGCMRSGDIVMFRGFEHLLQRAESGGDMLGAADVVQTIPIPCPVKPSDGTIVPTVSSLHIDHSTSSSRLVLLGAYENDAHFYRITITIDTPGRFDINIDIFGDASFGPLSCISPYFATTPTQSSFILTGNHMGCVSVYDWRSSSSAAATQAAIPPVRRFEAHADGSAVTAIHWNCLTLITGAANGVTRVFDGLTFEGLRSFASPTPRFRGRGHAPPVDPSDDGRVRQILVSPDQEVMIVSVGNAVLTWKAGPVGKNTSGGVRGRVPLNSHGQRKRRNNGGKWLQQVELKQDVAESRHMLEQERKKTRKMAGKAKEHQTSFNELGLNEQEALEYAMMLSREACTQTLGIGESSTTAMSDRELSVAVEEGVFGCEVDDVSSDNRGSTLSEGSELIPVSVSSSSSSNSERWDESWRSPSASVGSSPAVSVSADNQLHFPPVSIGPTTPINSAGSGSSTSSGESVRLLPTSAWRTPLMNTIRSSPTDKRQSTPDSDSVGSSDLGKNFDDDLRFALELSLAEARSRGGA